MSLCYEILIVVLSLFFLGCYFSLSIILSNENGEFKM